jgi:hypothetical protein
MAYNIYPLLPVEAKIKIYTHVTGTVLLSASEFIFTASSVERKDSQKAMQNVDI